MSDFGEPEIHSASQAEPPPRSRARRWAGPAVGVVIVAVVAYSYFEARNSGASGWCNATIDIRNAIADATDPGEGSDAVFAAITATALAEVPALSERAEGMSGSLGMEAEVIAAALSRTAMAETQKSMGVALTEFNTLDNEFRRDHCTPNRR